MSITEAEVREIIAGILELPAESLTDELGVGDIPQWESLAHMAILTTIEEAADLQIPEEQMMELSTVGSIIAFVCGAPVPPSVVAPEVTPAAAPAAASLPQSLPAAPTVDLPAYDGQPIVLTLQQRAAEHPAKTALVFDQESVTYHQLMMGIRRAAAYLRAQGVQTGDIVALYAEKSKEFFYCYFGAHLLGAAVLNLDSSIKEERRHYIFEQTHPCLCLGSGIQALSDYTELALETYATLPETVFPAMEAVADIMFTSGTTGEPKGVPLTHANLAAAAYQINQFIGTAAEDVEVLALPICHSFGMGRARCVLTVGGTIVLVPGFSNTKRLFAALADYRASGLAFVPAAWAYVQKMSGDALATHARHLRYIEIGSAAMEAPERRHLMQLFPQTRICMHYGLTEASRSAFIEFHAEAAHLDSAGKPSFGVEIAIFSPQGERLPQGAEGEICIKGRHVTSGYWKQEASQSRFGGFFRTGDWGVVDADGYLHIRSRTKDIINVGGKKVSPDEVETLLRSLPGVADAACVPAADPQGVLGEVVKAVLVSDGSPMPTDDDIRAFVAARAEHYKVPMLIEWRDFLPKTDSGKLQRRLV